LHGLVERDVVRTPRSIRKLIELLAETMPEAKEVTQEVSGKGRPHREPIRELQRSFSSNHPNAAAYPPTVKVNECTQWMAAVLDAVSGWWAGQCTMQYRLHSGGSLA
jgi:hypothetical protein